MKLKIAKGLFERLNLSIDAEDDLGLKKLEFKYKVKQRFER